MYLLNTILLFEKKKRRKTATKMFEHITYMKEKPIYFIMLFRYMKVFSCKYVSVIYDLRATKSWFFSIFSPKQNSKIL